MHDHRRRVYIFQSRDGIVCARRNDGKVFSIDYPKIIQYDNTSKKAMSKTREFATSVWTAHRCVSIVSVKETKKRNSFGR